LCGMIMVLNEVCVAMTGLMKLRSRMMLAFVLILVLVLQLGVVIASVLAVFVVAWSGWSIDWHIGAFAMVWRAAANEVW